MMLVSKSSVRIDLRLLRMVLLPILQVAVQMLALVYRKIFQLGYLIQCQRVIGLFTCLLEKLFELVNHLCIYLWLRFLFRGFLRLFLWFLLRFPAMLRVVLPVVILHIVQEE